MNIKKLKNLIDRYIIFKFGLIAIFFVLLNAKIKSFMRTKP